MTNEEIESVIQELYAWKSKRDAANNTNAHDPNFRKLDSSLITRTIRTLQQCMTEASTEDSPNPNPRHRLD